MLDYDEGTGRLSMLDFTQTMSIIVLGSPYKKKHFSSISLKFAPLCSEEIQPSHPQIVVTKRSNIEI